MTRAYIAGTGITQFGKFPDRGLKEHAQTAVQAALADAGIASSAVERVYSANAVAGLITGQEMIRGQSALRDTGLMGVPIVNVENACASGSSAFQLAVAAVLAGQCETALVLGVEKLTHVDKNRSFEAIGTAVDVEDVEQLRAEYQAAGAGAGTLFMNIYANEARAYTARTEATATDFAAVAEKTRSHGALNPIAQYRTATTVDEVLRSRMVSDPLTLLMCSPLGDGAAALVVSSERAARPSGVDPVEVLASELTSARREPPDLVTRAAAAAYGRAGIGPEDLDVVELHDATASAELGLYEQLSLCADGEGARLLRSGATRLGGRIPVNTSGGLLSRGHPVGATGVAQIVELVDQIRGTAGDRQVVGADVGLAQNAGGHLWGGPAVASVSILARAPR
jgi:acetyl-CoA acyltransferase